MKTPSLSTEAIARGCAIHPWHTILIWMLVLVFSGSSIMFLLDDGITNQTKFLNNPESTQADDLLEEQLRGPEKANEVVIVTSQTLTVDDPVFRERVESLYESIMELKPEVIEWGTHYYEIPHESMVSDDRHSTILPFYMTGTIDDASSKIGQVHEIVDAANQGDEFEILITGNATADKDFRKIAKHDMEVAELVGVPLAIIILILVFGTIVAAFIPLGVASVGIVTAIGVAAVIGQAFELSVFVTNMIGGMGLAVGIDYSLLIVSRYREERKRGLAKIDAITTAGGTAGRAVTFSGIAVALAILGVLIVPSTQFTSIGVGAMLAVIAAVFVSLTLLPAILSLLGDRVNTWSISGFTGKLLRKRSGSNTGFWDMVANAVMRHPLISAVTTAVLLLAMAAPTFAMNIGTAGISTFPDGIRSREGFEALDANFTAGFMTPAEIVIKGQIESDAVQEGIVRLQTALDSDPAFDRPIVPPEKTDEIYLLSIPVSGDSTSSETIKAVRRLRSEHIPEAFSGVDAEVMVTGATAREVDNLDMTSDYIPIVFAFVLGLSFVLLMVVFRSIVVPIKAIIMNLLSVGAAYGLVVLIFQKGIGASLLGFNQVDTFEAWVPIFLFCILFGLSMDYHVFLLTRIRERFDETQDNRESVAFGLRTTAGMITGAALIIAAIWAGYAAGDLVMLQQSGVGVAVALILDATIVRSVLVPATMQLLGKANWYLPKALQWLPDVRLREDTMSRHG